MSSSINSEGPVMSHSDSDFSDIFRRNSYGAVSGVRPRPADAHVSFNNSHAQSTCSEDLVKVEITDLECNASTNITIGALRRCKRHIVSPFYGCLKFVGWRQFGYGRVSYGVRWAVFNYVYLVTILLLLLFTYIFAVVACNARLSAETDDPDMMITTLPPPTPTAKNRSTTAVPWISMEPPIPVTTKEPKEKDLGPTTCDHIFSLYIIPNILHLLAYLMGFVHFRIRANEDLDSLMEKVFLYCEATYTRHVSQKLLIRRLKSYLYFLIFWTCFAVAVHILCDVVTLRDKVPLIDKISNPSVTITLFAIDMVGTLIAVGVVTTVILNYVVNCELIIFYAKLVIDKLRERSLNLRVAIKDLYQINLATKRLNSTTSVITSLILLICLERIAIGTSIIARIHKNRASVWAYRVLYIVQQIPILLLPLIQASRVNSFCSRFRRTILEIRTFGYQNALTLELDSLVLFSKANKFQAKLFFVPILGSSMIMGTVAACFVFLLLLQNQYITKLPYI